MEEAHPGRTKRSCNSALLSWQDRLHRVGRRQHLVAGFVTNVPGQVDVFRLAGAPVVAIWPVAVLAANVRLGVAAVSYAGRLRCGVHFDAENVSGETFALAMGEELSGLVA